MDVVLPLNDAGLVWGAIVTDRLRTFGGKLFALDAHLRRFRHSCELARIPQPIPDARLARITEQLVRDNRRELELSAIWLATPGPIPGIGGADAQPIGPTLIAYTSPLDPRKFEQLVKEGARLIPTATAYSVDPRIKHRSRLGWWTAEQQVHAQDALADPLFIESTRNQVLETPSANVLAVIDGTVVSPPRDRILNGITLGVVEDLCKHLELQFLERAFTTNDLKKASEVLLTNTSFCLVGVSSIGDLAIPFPGPTLARLTEGLSQWVGVDIRGQMTGPHAPQLPIVGEGPAAEGH